MRSIFIYLNSILTLILTSACSTSSEFKAQNKDQGAIEVCTSAREYVTTYNYLSSNQEKLGLSQTEIKEVAKGVAKGCSGAAARFIKSFETLNKVGLGGRSSLKTGVLLANKPDEHAKAFLAIFKAAYLKKHLDLDMRTSFKIASALSFDFKGQPQRALNDFKKLTKFCIENKNINLSLATCAGIAARVVKNSENYHKDVAKDFIATFMYVRKDSSLKLDIRRAVVLTEEIVNSGPGAGENFKVAYEFGLAKKGLNFSAKQALNFARNIVKSANEAYMKRMPASSN